VGRTLQHQGFTGWRSYRSPAGAVDSAARSATRGWKCKVCRDGRLRLGSTRVSVVVPASPTNPSPVGLHLGCF
jgi:hypothetical protein